MNQTAPQPAATSPRPRIGLIAQLLTGLGMCLIALPIIWLQKDPKAAFGGPVPLMSQLLVGHVLALLAAFGSYALFRLTKDAASTARTVDTYARLDLRGLNPLWIAIAAAIGEEMLFRAALQPFLGVWIVSLLFLLTHVPVYRFRKLDRATLVQAGGIFLCSVMLGYIFQRVGLVAAILVHMWIDIVGLVAVRNLAGKRSGQAT